MCLGWGRKMSLLPLRDICGIVGCVDRMRGGFRSCCKHYAFVAFPFPSFSLTDMLSIPPVLHVVDNDLVYRTTKTHTMPYALRFIRCQRFRLGHGQKSLPIPLNRLLWSIDCVICTRSPREKMQGYNNAYISNDTVSWEGLKNLGEINRWIGTPGTAR